ncbi:helix-turn-helix domain-containing protein [Kitasatospora sp. NPDC089797]|uniref:winged helix-turn-helix transcriptional regulator n=1 Tax=Kitasatospora sp. NPDC089797 TaxID=3155298 RepID=UPI003417E4D0
MTEREQRERQERRSVRIDPVNCSMGRALSVVGERWSLLIVREALDGVRRFGDFRARLGIAGNLLSTRLDGLVATGVLERVPYREPGDRQRFEYRLTAKGVDLRPTVIALLEWGDKYLADEQGPSVVVRHGGSGSSEGSENSEGSEGSGGADGPDGSGCDAPVTLVLECAAGHTHLPPGSVYRAPGPGARFLPG